MALGTDFSGVLDIDPAWRVVDGKRALAQAVARRLSTPLGSLADHPDYGFDLRSAIGTSMTESQIFQGVQSQVLAEEQVESATIKVTLDDGALEVLINLVTAEEPFEFTVLVDDLAVTAIIP